MSNQVPDKSTDESTKGDHYWADRYFARIAFLVLIAIGFILMLWGSIALVGNYLLIGTQFGGSGAGMLDGLVTMLVGAFLLRVGVRAEL